MQKSRTPIVVASIIGIISIIVLLVAVGWLEHYLAIDAEIALSLVVVCALVGLLASLGLLAVTFAGFELSDRSQAMGLPEGSIRAAIALSVVLLFGIMTIFLYRDLGASKNTSELHGLTIDQRNKYIESEPLDIVSATTDPPANAQAATTYSLRLRSPSNAASVDFAKQLLTMIGTLVTSVIAFYFGAKTATSAQTAATASLLGVLDTPKIHSISPATMAPGVTYPVTIDGSGLNETSAVRLESANKSPIRGSDVSSSDSAVKCQIVADPNVGSWDLVLIDRNGKEVRAKDAIAVKIGVVSQPPIAGGPPPAAGGAAPEEPDHPGASQALPTDAGLGSDVLATNG